MKKNLLFLSLLAATFFTYGQNVGIGTAVPLTKLHVFNGASGATPFAFSPLVVENNGHTYINILSPAANEGAILFGQPGSSANGVIMYNNTSTPNGFQFRNNGNLTRMVIDNAGRVGIGIIAPACPFDVTGNASTTGNFVNTATIDYYYSGVSGSCNVIPDYGIGVVGKGGFIGVHAEAILPGSGDRYGISSIAQNGTSNYGVYGTGSGGIVAQGIFGFAGNGSSYNYGVSGEASGGVNTYGVYGIAYLGSATNWAGFFGGSVYTAGTYQSSDRKLKNDIQSLNGALSIINQLNPSVYTYKTNEYKQMQLPEGLHYGLIADEVQQVIPGIVKKAIQPAQYEKQDGHTGKKLSDEVEFNAVNYTEIIPILVGAIKEQQAIINSLQIQIDELKKLADKSVKQ